MSRQAKIKCPCGIVHVVYVKDDKLKVRRIRPEPAEKNSGDLLSWLDDRPKAKSKAKAKAKPTPETPPDEEDLEEEEIETEGEEQ